MNDIALELNKLKVNYGVENAVRPQNKHLIPFKKGDNMGSHRPLGKKNYETLRKEAVIELGKELKKTPAQIDMMLVKSGIQEALIEKDYRYYKDDLDRVHGQAVSRS